MAANSTGALDGEAGSLGRRLEPAFTVWLATGIVVALLFVAAPHVPLIDRWPEEWFVPLADWVSAATDWFLIQFRAVFRTLTWIFAIPLGWLRDLLQWIPWPAVIIAAVAMGYAVGDWKLALFIAGGLLYVVITGYWQPTMYTLAVVGVAVPISILTGLMFGILAHRSRAVRRAVEPALDLMQTIPTFAYLIPILVLFGLGPVVGMLATAIYAIPPMVRNVMLGLDRVPVEITESAMMSGSTRGQRLWWVELPAALPAILMGVNQTIMAGLSMVVIAAIVGGFPDIGLEVFTTMKKAEFGQSILAGLVIALLAMILDRTSRAYAARQMDPRRRMQTSTKARICLWVAVAAILVLSAAAELLWSGLRIYPESWVFYPAQAMNQAVEWFTREFFFVTQAIKSWALLYFMLPLKIGLEESVNPRFWGFTMDEMATAIYAVGAAALVLFAGFKLGWRVAVGAALALLVYFFGTLGIPWTAFILIATVVAWQVGGWRMATLAILSFVFIAVTGGWDQAMISIQLCGAGVVISFLIGAALGIWAAQNDRVSAFLRPINDTLQTMPIFVFLIPGIMVFLVGEFTALVAIVMYATVPTIRYTEHGLRNVPAQTVEAARAFGATRNQLLFQVELPLALPEIMLGLNQTIMMGLAMVVVAALVGAKGLGQEVMVALTWADVGLGAVAGLSVALIAIVTDRLLQSWSQTKKRELGLA